MKLATIVLTSTLTLIALPSQAAEPTQTAATGEAMQSNPSQPTDAMQTSTGQPTETMQSETGQPTDAMQSNVSQPAGWIARAALTSAVDDREPVDSVSTLSNDNTTLFYFTEVRDMAGQTITHRWEHNGEVMAEVEFQIGGPRWRIYSSKTLMPTWLGDWKVSAIDAAGNPLTVNNFVYTEAATISEQPQATGTTEQPQAMGAGEQTGTTSPSEQKPQ